MISQKRSLLYLPVWITLVVLISFSETGAARCLYTHGDPYCEATGHLPLPLTCSFPGKWFTIKSVSKHSGNGIWQKVPAANIAQERCKATRTVQAGAGSQCMVSGNLPEVSAKDVTKVEFYCWEIDPDLLGGFGKMKTRIFNPRP